MRKPIKESGDNYIKGFSKDVVFHSQQTFKRTCRSADLTSSEKT